MPASGPVSDPKTFPAATMDDQEEIMAGEQERVVFGAPPFSSPDPATDAQKLLPLEDGTSAHQAALEAEAARMTGEDYSKMNAAALKNLVEERDLEIEGTGKDGNVTKEDRVNALRADDAKDMKAADFKQRITAASTQEELDEVAELYDAQDTSYKTVEDAFDKKQEEINEADAAKRGSGDNQ